MRLSAIVGWFGEEGTGAFFPSAERAIYSTERDTAMALEHERKVYETHLMDLLANEGKYILVRGDDIAGPWDSYVEALQHGYDLYGPVPFLLKKIQRSEPLHYFTRDLPKCPS